MKRVLVIDYTPEIRELVIRQLEHLGYEGADGGAGGELPEAAGSFDALIVEPVRPDALAYASLLRETSPGLPIVIMSIAGSSAATAALAPVAHLVKPVTLARLEAVLESATSAASEQAGPPGPAPRGRMA